MFFNDNEINVNIPNFCPPVYLPIAFLFKVISCLYDLLILKEKEIITYPEPFTDHVNIVFSIMSISGNGEKIHILRT